MDAVIAGVAEQQHGVIALSQVLEAGGSVDLVAGRVRQGRWQIAARGVYRVAGAPRTWGQRVMTLVLASGPEAAASHRTAAALLGLPGFARSGDVEVTTPRRRRHRDLGGTVHRWRPFPAHHLTLVDGIPTTRVARTLVDLAGVLHPRRTERAVDNCLGNDTISVHDLADVAREMASRGRAGTALMRKLLEARGAGYVATASELEDRFEAVRRAAGLPAPVRQLDTGDDDDWVGRVDFTFPDARLIVEVDSRRHHSTLLDSEADRCRDHRLVAAGWRVVRVTSGDLTERSDYVASLLRRLLARTG